MQCRTRYSKLRKNWKRTWKTKQLQEIKTIAVGLFRGITDQEKDRKQHEGEY